MRALALLLALLLPLTAVSAPAPTPKPVRHVLVRDLYGTWLMQGHWRTVFHKNGKYTASSGTTNWLGDWYMEDGGPLHVWEQNVECPDPAPSYWHVVFEKDADGLYNLSSLRGLQCRPDNTNSIAFTLTRGKKK